MVPANISECFVESLITIVLGPQWLGPQISEPLTAGRIAPDRAPEIELLSHDMHSIVLPETFHFSCLNPNLSNDTSLQLETEGASAYVKKEEKQ